MTTIVHAHDCQLWCSAAKLLCSAAELKAVERMPLPKCLVFLLVSTTLLHPAFRLNMLQLALMYIDSTCIQTLCCHLQLIQRRCSRCDGSGLVERGPFLRKCPECGGFFPWQGWKRFLTSTATPGNGGVLRQPRNQDGVIYKYALQGLSAYKLTVCCLGWQLSLCTISAKLDVQQAPCSVTKIPVMTPNILLLLQASRS